jgi:hypothetical protein
MQVFHTAGVPPNMGRTIFANIGWTQNRRAELTKRVTENRASKRVSRFNLDSQISIVIAAGGAVPSDGLAIL